MRKHVVQDFEHSDLAKSENGGDSGDTSHWQGTLARLIPKNNETISLTVLVLVLAVFTVATNGLILSLRTLNIIATFGPEILIITVASGLVILGGHIDLSVGSIYVASSVVLGHLAQVLDLPIIIAAIAAVAVAAVLGFVNGWIVTRTGISSFIVTLGTMWAFRGLMLVTLGPKTISVYRASGSILLFEILAGKTVVIAHQVYWLILVMLVLQFMFMSTRFGIHLKGVGSNERASRMVGIVTRRVTVQVFTLSGALCGFAGVIQVAQSGQAVPQSGESVMLNALAGAIIGGVSLLGGRGGVIGPLIGGLTLLVITYGFIMMGVVEFWTDILVAIAVIFTAFAFLRLERFRVEKG